MARFKKHVIAYGDTPQIIAEREMGEVSLWFDLVKHNKLEYPYIVDTVEEKQKNPKHLVTIGDTIIIPTEQTLADIDTAKLSKYDKYTLQDLVLGNDLAVGMPSEHVGKHGADDEILELTSDNRGDLQLVRGKDNVVQILKMRLLTPKGSLPLHPDYGSDIQSIIGLPNTAENVLAMDTTIQEALEADTRIRSAKLLNHSVNGTYYSSSWEVGLQSFDTFFRILVQRDNDNNFLIL